MRRKTIEDSELSFKQVLKNLVKSPDGCFFMNHSVAYDLLLGRCYRRTEPVAYEQFLKYLLRLTSILTKAGNICGLILIEGLLRMWWCIYSAHFLGSNMLLSCNPILIFDGRSEVGNLRRIIVPGFVEKVGESLRRAVLTPPPIWTRLLMWWYVDSMCL